MTTRASDFEEGLLLVVDDDCEWRESSAMMLKRMGCTVVQAETVEEALSLVRSLRPAGIVLDVAMECGAGWTLLEVLKSDRRTESIPVVVATAHEDILAALSAGAKEVLLKPVQHAELAGALKRVGACPKKFVVAVDEDPRALDLYERLLAPQGYHVVRCNSPKRVGAVVEETEPDLVLVNWMTLLASGKDLERTQLPLVGVAPHPLSPRVRAELKDRLPIDVVPSDGSRPSFRKHLGRAIAAATPTVRPKVPPRDPAAPSSRQFSSSEGGPVSSRSSSRPKTRVH